MYKKIIEWRNKYSQFSRYLVRDLFVTSFSHLTCFPHLMDFLWIICRWLYSDPSQIIVREKKFIYRYLPIHNQFSTFVLSQNTDPHLQYRVPFFQPILFWWSFRIKPEKDRLKMGRLHRLPRCLTWIDDHGDTSWGLDIAKNHTGRDLASTVDEMTVQLSVFKVFLHHSQSIMLRIILVQNPPTLQFRVFPINKPLEDLQDFKVIFLIDESLWWHKGLIKRALVVKEHD